MARDEQGRGDHDAETVPPRGDDARAAWDASTHVHPPGPDAPPGAAATPPAGAPRPGAVTGLDAFRAAVLEVRLMTAEELDGALAALPADRRPADAEGLARELVRLGRLTPCQAAALYQGKARGLVVGKYVILDKLGAGGMGMVFKARHARLGRVVALKLLPPSFARDATLVARFRREAEAASRINHPNVVAALDADEYRGVHFFVMEYVEGKDLDRLVAARGVLAPSRAIDCVLQAARGLAEAHARGIVHRDIKPSNLLVDRAGTVKVLDLGLARIVEASHPLGTAGDATGAKLTQSGTFMGTVDYMSPEQASDSRRVDHRADVYSLGCTLHFLLTGRPPYAADTVLRRIMAHMEGAIPSLRDERPEVSWALDDLFRRMLAKDPADRPQTMAEVVAALEACRSPGSSHALGVVDDARGPSSTTLSAARTDPGASATAPTQHAPEWNISDLLMDVHEGSGPAAARPASVPTARRAGLRPGRRRRARLAVCGGLGAAAAVGLLALALRGRGGGDRDLPMAPDLVQKEPAPPAAPAKEAVPTPPEDTKEPADGTGGKAEEPTPTAVAPGPPTAPAGPGRLAELGRFAGPIGGPINNDLAVAPDGARFLAACRDGRARLWDVATGGLLDGLRHESGAILAVALGPGNLAATGGADGTARLWDLADRKELRRLEWSSGPARTVALSADGARALVGGRGGLWVVDVGSGKATHRFDLAGRLVNLARFAPDGRRALASTDGGDLMLLELGRDLAAPGGHSVQFTRLAGGLGFVWGVAMADDGVHALSGGAGKVRAWDLDRRAQVGAFDIPNSGGGDLALLPDGRRVVYCLQVDDGDRVVLRDVPAGRDLRRGDPGAGQFLLQLLPDGERLLTAGADGVVHLWSLADDVDEAYRLLDGDRRDAATGAFAKAIARRPGDARLRIEHARLLAEAGAAGAADEEYRRAAALAPDNPQLFLDAGWWAVGPFPVGRGDLDGLRGALRDPLPPERDPDPAAPALGVPGTRAWRRLTPNPDGWLDLGPVGGDGTIAYALAYVYATERREVVLALGVDDLARVWQDGRLVFEQDHPPPSAPGRHHVPVTLHPGRNVLLAKVVNAASAHRLHARLIESPTIVGRALARAGRLAEAGALLDQAVMGHLDAPRARVARGRTRIEAGRKEEGRRDLAEAAELAPGELDLFLEEWWVVGPVPADLHANPVNPEAVDPTATVAGKLRWRAIRRDPDGQVDLGTEFFPNDRAAAYAFNDVDSREPREVLLRVRADDHVRVWVNGKPAFEHASGPAMDADAARVVSLQAGPNAVLVKVVNEGGRFTFRLGLDDDPGQIADIAAGEGRWKEAAATLARVVRRAPEDGLARYKHGLALLRAGDLKGYRDACAEALPHADPAADFDGAVEIARLCALTPDGVTDHGRVRRLAEDALRGRTPRAWDSYVLGLARLRAGDPHAAAASLDASNGRGWGGEPAGWAARAIALRRQNKPREAWALLDQAHRWHVAKVAEAKRTHAPMTGGLPWWDWADLELLLKEADDAIKH